MSIGLGQTDVKRGGKALIPGTKALLQADYEEYWPVSNDKFPLSTAQDQYPGYTIEQIRDYNTIDEGTLTNEALKYFKDQPSINDKKGHVIESVATKQRTDRKLLYYSN